MAGTIGGKAREPVNLTHLRRGWRFAGECLLPVAVAVPLVADLFCAPGRDALDLAAVMVGSLALVAWRRAPLVPLLVTTACMLVHVLHAPAGLSAALPVLVSVFAAARAGHQLLAALAGVVFLGAGPAMSPAADSSHPGHGFAGSTGLLLGWFIASGLVGVVIRLRQPCLRKAEQDSVDAERVREEDARWRADHERLRIARELHHSLTQNISVIKVQAGVAVHLARKRGEEVPAALLAIQEASGDAMRELGATQHVLHDPR
ncbi:histidine kinase [Actinomadura luzonensis]|uniref:histidine kinase n=1 Tax=Actinomadura luzonensis TaxID=2805427 RepID=UPI002000112A|nr:histidine kinase dimerization/phosphoacceptor domain-containing protein [Actinomadura luzonensis]